jgi:peptide deformylase
MVKTIMKDVLFLGQKSEPATPMDRQVVEDLFDTLKAHKDGCVGMAANMIGVKKSIIAVNMGMVNVAMINAVITKKTGSYETEERCLSLQGKRKTTRYKEIEVEFIDIAWKKQKQKSSGWIAQIIQHECDHIDGIVI